MLLLKIIFLQLSWFIVVLFGKKINPFVLNFSALILALLNYLYYRPKLSVGRYLFLIALFLGIGFLNDTSLIFFKFIYKDSYHYGNLALWIIFIFYYDQIFIKLQDKPLAFNALLGGIGGMFTYLSAVKLGALVIIPGAELKFSTSQFIFWAAFFPVSLKLYFKANYWEHFLDKTIFFSFDQSGYRRHQKQFTEDLNTIELSGKNILVTGATGGIGSAVVSQLAKLVGKVFFTGRNQEKGLLFEAKNKNSKFMALDMANWKDIHEFCKNAPVFQCLVFNAGSMPEKLSVNEYDIEFQCASQLLGHYLLLIWLKEFNKIQKGTRIVWVSSGGMYLKKLDLLSLFKNPHYEKVDTYANVKRAQVTLVEELVKQDEWKDFFIYSMHPGWVGTDGLKEALPKFYSFMKKRLRTAEEGADTIIWCIVSQSLPINGGFFFDRKKVAPYFSDKYNPTTEERVELLKAIDQIKALIKT